MLLGGARWRLISLGRLRFCCCARYELNFCSFGVLYFSLFYLWLSDPDALYNVSPTFFLFIVDLTLLAGGARISSPGYP